MFTELFSVRQKKVFLKIAETILTSDDGGVDELEQNYLLQICNEMRLIPNDKEDFSFDDLPQIFPEDETRKVLVIECIFLAYSNKVYHEQEKELVGKIGGIFDFPDSLLDSIQNEIESMARVQENLLNFIFGEE